MPSFIKQMMYYKDAFNLTIAPTPLDFLRQLKGLSIFDVQGKDNRQSTQHNYAYTSGWNVFWDYSQCMFCRSIVLVYHILNQLEFLVSINLFGSIVLFKLDWETND